MNDKITIVTGAAGFIGSAVVRYLNDKGYDALVLVDDIKSTTKWKNLLGKRFIDFISKHHLFTWLTDHVNEVEAVIHLGACSDTLETNGDYLMENNFRYTQKLAEISLKHGIRFIYASSAATYGDGSLGFCDDPDLLDELRPLNLYGFSKHLFDLWAKKQGILDQIVGLKYFNVFGPNEAHKGHMASMVFKMFPKVTTEGSVQLFKSTDLRFENGDQCRDFIYVKDAARMTCNFLFNKICGIFNIGRGTPTTWNQLARALFNAASVEERIEYVEMPESLKKQYQNYTCADMNRYLKSHQFNSKASMTSYDIEEGVRDYVQTHLLGEKQW